MELSIVMPCLNEARTVATCVTKARQWLEAQGVRGEILVADNGSTDGSQAIAAAHGARVVPVDIKGYGAALIAGIEAAQGRFIIMGDADDSYDFTHLERFLDKLREGYDLVMGNRFQGGIMPGAMPPLNRYLGNPVLSGFGRLFFHAPIGDFHCGLRGFSKAAALRMDLRCTGMEFASELVVKAFLLGMRVTEVPTTLAPDGRDRSPHLRPWRDGWRHLRFLLIYSPRWLFFQPGVCLMVSGAGVGLWLLPQSQTLRGVTYDVHTLLYAAMAVLIGFQAISFAAFTRLFALSEGLVPEDAQLSRLSRVVTLEVGLVIGGILMLAGLGSSVYAMTQWSARGFGPMDVGRTMRLVIPSATVLVLGCQIVLSSFFMSVLWLRRRRSSILP
jgi:uncharacterized membrane protein YidH (DUF202 family)